ncbi:MAG: AmmeMemoRadiSam system protein A [Acidobacteria bacterium]|nr:AmmeMemoRadiSam system protein A [Acidobacteriota bacterium]
MSLLSAEHKSLLLQLARRSIEFAACGQVMQLPSAIPVPLMRPAGAFVSLHESAELRGCVGFLTGEKPLYETVIEAAAAAAIKDTRFLPVTKEEVPTLEIEISILSEFRETSPDQIEVGVHGLLVSSGRLRGLLLPQVPVERGWNALRFLDETCRKAGLPPGAWNHGAKIEVFTAEVFGEPDHNTLDRAS